MDSFNQEEIEQPRKYKKVLVIIAAIFLIILFLVYSFFIQISGIISGLFESEKINNNFIELNKTSSIYFENNTYEKILKLHELNKSVELKACLLGFLENKNYIINKIFYPEIISQKHNQVISKPCPKETLVDLHSHPYNHCLASEQDFISFNKTNIPIMAIMCEEDRFNFYIR